MDFARIGLTAAVEAAYSPFVADGHLLGRVISEQKGQYSIICQAGEFPAVPTGRMLHMAANRVELPVVGDWVVIMQHEEIATIHAVLPRHTFFVRKAAGRETQAQPLAANVDTALLMMGLDGNYSLRRLERYLLLTTESGAMPLIVLTKADLCGDVAAVLQEVKAIAPGVPVVAISVIHHDSLAALVPYLREGETLVLLGMSGVGKSTLLNALMGAEVQVTGAVRGNDNRGRHTTSHRELFQLLNGALVIDTPGMRELALMGDEGMEIVFPDIASLAQQCRFVNCQHETEPSCAVRVALQLGTLDKERFESFRKLRRERALLERQINEKKAREERLRSKKISKVQRVVVKSPKKKC